MHPEDRALTPAEMVGVVLAEAKRRGLPWHRARTLAIDALPWSPEKRGPRPGNEDVIEDLMDWYDAIMWALPALRAAYLGTTAPVLTSTDNDFVTSEEFDPADFSRYVAMTDAAPEPVPAGEWAPEGFEDLDLD